MKTKKGASGKRFKGNQRKKQLDEGFFDGRFIPRVENPKTKYKRKPKYKPDYDED